MSTATKTAPPTAEQRQAAAETALTEADTAREQAHAAANAARQAVDTAEAELVEALANGSTRPRIEQARQALTAAQAEAELADLTATAAEIRYSRTADLAAAARRAVVAEEYVAAHRDYNAPDNRETVLLAQLTATVAELARIIPERQAHHDYLAVEVGSWPPGERPALTGRPILTYGHRGLGVWTVEVPLAELADAIKAGLTEAH